MWTLSLYIIHVIVHSFGAKWFPKLYSMHLDHHSYVNKNPNTSWKLNNLLLFNDTWRSTIDLWVTEVIPTIIFSMLTGHWWVSVLYYLWAALIQESIEHNKNVNFYPFITSGTWHLVHHKYTKNNYGLFIPIWDIIFKTERR